MIMNYGIYSGDFKGESGNKDSIAEISLDQKLKHLLRRYQCMMRNYGTYSGDIKVELGSMQLIVEILKEDQEL